ncbi:hypothetical protein [Methanorbis furvi]|uniref:hypothetical protein n=1 Tax=Methanorbis furvi TaxID=3028299 RepID=UPI0030B871F5
MTKDCKGCLWWKPGADYCKRQMLKAQRMTGCGYTSARPEQPAERAATSCADVRQWL